MAAHARVVGERTLDADLVLRPLDRHVAILGQVVVDVSHTAELREDEPVHPVVFVAGVAVVTSEVAVPRMDGGKRVTVRVV